MSFKEFLRINKYKVIWFIGLVLFFWFGEQFIDFAEFIIGLIFSIIGPFQVSITILALAHILNFILNIALFYLIACMIFYIYDKLSAKFPKIKTFFELTPAKYKIMGILFVLFLIFANLSAIFSQIYWYSDFARVFFAILSMLLGIDDVSIIHRFYMGTWGLDKIPSLMMAILWWYLLSCIIMFIKNKISNRK